MNADGRVYTALFFALFFSVALAFAIMAAKATKSANSFFAADGKITAFQNGLALAGDFIAASAFLGVTGIAALRGSEAIVPAVAIAAGWPLMMILLVEPLRALGKYTFSDVLEYRFGNVKIKACSAIITVSIVLPLLSMQIAGGGNIIRLLFGFNYQFSVIVVSIVMLTYVLTGGMLATTWIQITKIIILLMVVVYLVSATLHDFNFSLSGLLSRAARNGDSQVLGPSSATTRIDVLSLGVSTILGVATLPQVFMRFFTVRNVRAARRSMLIATVIIASSLLAFVFLGFAAMAILGTAVVRAADRGGNMAIPLLATHFGGLPLLGFVGAVSSATILASVCGILLSGSAALAHDLWVGFFRSGRASDREELIVGRLATVALALAAAAIALLIEGMNLFTFSNLSAAIASSTIFPALVLTCYWKKFTFPGAVAGLLGGLMSSLLLIWTSPVVQQHILHHHGWNNGLDSPAIVSVPVAFFSAWLVSMLTRSPPEGDRYAEIDQLARNGWRPITPPARVSAA